MAFTMSDTRLGVWCIGVSSHVVPSRKSFVPSTKLFEPENVRRHIHVVGSVLECSPCGIALLKFLINADKIFYDRDRGIDKEFLLFVVQSFGIRVEDSGL